MNTPNINSNKIKTEVSDKCWLNCGIFNTYLISNTDIGKFIHEQLEVQRFVIVKMLKYKF